MAPPDSGSPLVGRIGLGGCIGVTERCVLVGGRTRSLIDMSVSFQHRASRSGAHLGKWLTRHQLSSRDTPVDTVVPTTAPTQTCAAVDRAEPPEPSPSGRSRALP